LRIALKDIRDGLSTLDITCGVEETGLEAEGVCFTDPVTASLKLFRQDDKVFVKAELSVVMELECARCLSPVHRQLTGTFENQYQYQPLLNTPQRLMDDIGIRYYSEDYIDLSDDIKEGLILEIPARIICSDNCKGLCPHCGQNLNQRECDCRLESEEEAQTSKLAEYIKTLNIKNKLGV